MATKPEGMMTRGKCSKWKAMSNASSTMAACQARRLRRRSPRDSISSIRPTMTSEVRVTLVSVPGTTALNLCSRSCQSGLKTASTSERPTRKVSSAATPGIQVSGLRWLPSGAALAWPLRLATVVSPT